MPKEDEVGVVDRLLHGMEERGRTWDVVKNVRMGRVQVVLMYATKIFL